MTTLNYVLPTLLTVLAGFLIYRVLFETCTTKTSAIGTLVDRIKMGYSYSVPRNEIGLVFTYIAYLKRNYQMPKRCYVHLNEFIQEHESKYGISFESYGNKRLSDSEFKAIQMAQVNIK